MPKQSGCFVSAFRGLNLVDVVFAGFHQQLAEKGYIARAGQMIDATFVEVPRQRNTREENAQLKAGEVPEAWDKPEAKAKRRQKDTEARWTKKERRETLRLQKSHQCRSTTQVDTKLCGDTRVGTRQSGIR